MSIRLLTPPENLTAALFGEALPSVIAFVGAGGKTSAMKTAARQLNTVGKRVIITTTTKMHPPEDTALLTDNLEKTAALLDDGQIVWFGSYYNEYKIEGIPGSLPALSKLADVVLVEADGARKHPLKMIDPSHEPVIPPEAEAVVAVAGLDAVGMPLGEAVHRPELACAALGVTPEHIVTPSDTAALLSLCYAPRNVLLNKADTPERIEIGHAVAERLPEAVCVITSLQSFHLALGALSEGAVSEAD